MEEEREEGRSESRVQSSTCLPVGLRGVEKGENPEFRVQSGCLELRKRKRWWGSSLSDFPEEGLRELMNSEFRGVSVQLESGNSHYHDRRASKASLALRELTRRVARK